MQDFQYIEPLGLLPNTSGDEPWTIKKRIIGVEELITQSGSDIFIENELFLYTPDGTKYARLVVSSYLMFDYEDDCKICIGN